MAKIPNDPTPQPKAHPKKKGGFLKIGLIVIAVIIALGIIGAMFGGDDTGTKTEATQPTATESVAAETPTKAPTPATTPLKDQIERAVSDARDGMSKFKWDNGVVTVTYDSGGGFWDDNSIIHNLARDTVDVMAAAFAFNEVKRVNTVYLAEMTDEYGNAKVERGVQIDWTRKNWANVKDPEAFKTRLAGDETLMYRLATAYYVHPGIWKNTKLKEEGMPAFGGAQ